MADQAKRLAEALQPGRVWRPKGKQPPYSRSTGVPRLIRRLQWGNGWEGPVIQVFGSTRRPDGTWREVEGGIALWMFLQRFEPDEGEA